MFAECIAAAAIVVVVFPPNPAKNKILVYACVQSNYNANFIGFRKFSKDFMCDFSSIVTAALSAFLAKKFLLIRRFFLEEGVGFFDKGEHLK